MQTGEPWLWALVCAVAHRHCSLTGVNFEHVPLFRKLGISKFAASSCVRRVWAEEHGQSRSMWELRWSAEDHGLEVSMERDHHGVGMSKLWDDAARSPWGRWWTAVGSWSCRHSRAKGRRAATRSGCRWPDYAVGPCSLSTRPERVMLLRGASAKAYWGVPKSRGWSGAVQPGGSGSA